MTKHASPDPIPPEIARHSCWQIRQEYAARPLSPGALQCWRCAICVGGDLKQMQVSRTPGFRGCALVNALYDTLVKESADGDA
jgi:hypothetical protein